MTHWSQIKKKKNELLWLILTVTASQSNILLIMFPGMASQISLKSAGGREQSWLTASGLLLPVPHRSSTGHAPPRLFRSAATGWAAAACSLRAICSGGEEHLLFWLRCLEMLCSLKQFLISIASLFPFLSAWPTS